MKLVPNGPNIPFSLIQKHKEGNVVFFCGAGISCGSGLPNFKDLVMELFDTYAYDCPADSSLFESAEEERESQHPDKNELKLPLEVCINLLENNLLNGRQTIRQAVWKRLAVNKRNLYLSTHTALLNLAKDKYGRLHLVTTNFDHLFSRASKKEKIPLKQYRAPMLPIPNHTRWDGLVYLHGLLPRSPKDQTALNQLVLSSGDFGRAYLQEGWARRFLLDLFRNYTVCFVGYSLNDATLRYLTDAIAADKEQGEASFQNLYAFCSEDEQKAWEEKGVKPIPFHDYQSLHLTLHKWSDFYLNETISKEEIFRQCAGSKPPTNDDEVARVIWALSDPSGQTAKLFANLNPPADITWLDKFEEYKLSSEDLTLFGVQSNVTSDNRTYSLLSRPLSNDKSEVAAIFKTENFSTSQDLVINEIANWLIYNYLGNPHLLAKAYNSSTPEWFRARIYFCLLGYWDISKQCEKELTPFMRLLWSYYISGRNYHISDFWLGEYYRKIFDVKKLSPYQFTLLNRLFTPKVQIKEQPNYFGQQRSLEVNQKNSIDRNIKLPIENLTDFRKKLNLYLKRNPSDALTLLRILESRFTECLELNKDLCNFDSVLLKVPSISDHSQNRKRGACGWERGIELIRDCWIVLFQNHKRIATSIAKDWAKNQFISYKRLYLFASTYLPGNCDHWTNFLTQSNAKNLWDPRLKREIAQLLLKKGMFLGVPQSKKIEKFLTTNKGTKSDHPEYCSCLYLTRLMQSGRKLTVESKNYLNKFSYCYTAERAEFTSYVTFNSDPEWIEEKRVEVPKSLQSLLNWLSNPKNDTAPNFNWEEFCIEKPELCLECFERIQNSQNGIPIHRLKNLIINFSSHDDLTEKYTPRLVELTMSLGDPDFQKLYENICNLVSDYYQAGFYLSEAVLFDLINKIFRCSKIESQINQSLRLHPMALATKCLLKSLFKFSENTPNIIPGSYKEVLSKICTVENKQFKPARSMIASYAGDLYKIEPDWSKEFLLPLFDWTLHMDEAEIAWEHYLRNFRINNNLMQLLYSQTSLVVKNFALLSNISQYHFTVVLFRTITDSKTKINIKKEVKEGIRQSKQNDRINFCDHVSEYCKDLLENTPFAQRPSVWIGQVKPFIKALWPRTKGIYSSTISKSLAHICLLSGSRNLVKTYEFLKEWIKPVSFYNELIDYACDDSNDLINKQTAKTLFNLFESLTDESTYLYGRDKLYKKLQSVDPSINFKEQKRSI
ncbi:MAG TPA: SIR2 family protein [Sutterellaceae bacterium]|nr:SIR2 family protein [Sutterellaceae bacterium]